MVCSQIAIFGFCCGMMRVRFPVNVHWVIGHQPCCFNDSRFCSTVWSKTATLLHLEHKTNKIHLHLIAHCFFFQQVVYCNHGNYRLHFLQISTSLVSLQGPHYSSLVYMHSVRCNDHQRDNYCIDRC